MSDPIDDVMNATWEERPRSAYGQVQVDTWHCVLEKGVGKVPFDATQHRPEDRRTVIHILVMPTANSHQQYQTERDMIAESREWAGIVKPSIVALKSDLRTINGKWAKCTLVPTGQKYQNKAGETKNRTTLRFDAIYPTEEACDKAENLARLQDKGFGQVESVPYSLPTNDAPVTPPQNPNERATALKFLPALWNGAGHDVEKFAASLSKNPLVSKYFDLNSAEVLALISQIPEGIRPEMPF